MIKTNIKFKKLVTLSLITTMAVFILMGCGDLATSEEVSNSNTTGTTQVEQNTPTDGPEDIGKEPTSTETDTDEVAQEPEKPTKKSINGFKTNEEVIEFLVNEEEGNIEYLNKLVESGVNLTQIPKFFLKIGNPKSDVIPGLVTEQLKKQGGVKTAKEVTIIADSRTDLTELQEATQLEKLTIRYDDGSSIISVHPGENYGTPILPDLSSLTNVKKLIISGGMWITDEQMHNLPSNIVELTLINPFISNTEFVKNYPNLRRLEIHSTHWPMLDSIINLEYLQKLEHLTIDTMADVTITEASRDFIKNRRFMSLKLPNIAGVLPTSGGAAIITLSNDKATDLSWVPMDIESSHLTIRGHNIKDLSGLKSILENPNINKVTLENLRNADFTTIKDETFESLDLAGTFWNPSGLADIKVNTVTLSNPNIELVEELAKSQHVNYVRIFQSPTRDLSIFKDSSATIFHVDYKSVDLETIPGSGDIYVEGITEESLKELPETLRNRVKALN